MKRPRFIAYVGSYAHPDQPSNEAGIRVFDLDMDTGAMSLLSASMPSMEAGFLSRSPDGRFLYGVDERKNDGRGPVGPEASVKAFSIAPEDGRITLLNSQAANGAFPTYIGIHPTGRWVITASHGSFEHVERVVHTPRGFQVEYLYDDSTLSLYPAGVDGTLNPACDVFIFKGHGKDPSDSIQVGRHPQASPHAHSATFDPEGRFFLVCEKSADRIYTFSIDTERGSFNKPLVYEVPSGSAPRHPIFHPHAPFVFVTNEMNSTLSSYRYDLNSGALTHVKTVPTLGSQFEGNAPADVQVHPSGRLVLVNNRGDDNIACFAFDEASGGLILRDSYPLAKSLHPGLASRSFAFDPSGRFVFVADRPADAVLTLSIDIEKSTFSHVRTTPVLQPASILVTQVGFSNP